MVLVLLMHTPRASDAYKNITFKNKVNEKRWYEYDIPYLWQVLEIHSVGDWWLVHNFALVTDYKRLDQKGPAMRLVDTV